MDYFKSAIFDREVKLATWDKESGNELHLSFLGPNRVFLEPFFMYCKADAVYLTLLPFRERLRHSVDCLAIFAGEATVPGPFTSR